MPTTLRLRADDPADLAHAAALLRAGETVAFPTETVYGLGAHALDEAAVARIFAAKGRPRWDPLIVHVADLPGLAAVAEVAAEQAERVRVLAENFWPGPLTLLLPRRACVPDAVTAGRSLVGVRMPGHPSALALLRLAGIPLAAPSANTFGHTSPTTAAHVLADLDGRIAAVLDGGPTRVGVESTVLDPASMTIYRPGAVTAAMLQAVTGVAVSVYVAPDAPPQTLPSPGVGIRHYAPRARLVLTEGSEAAVSEALLRLREDHAGVMLPGVMLPDGWKLADAAKSVLFAWGAWAEPAQLAARLFAGLRTLDDAGVATIVCPLPAAGGIGAALRDRLEKAARPK